MTDVTLEVVTEVYEIDVSGPGADLAAQYAAEANADRIAAEYAALDYQRGAVQAQGVRLYSGAEDIQPLIAGADGGIVIGVRRSTGDVIVKISPDNAGVLSAIFRAINKNAVGLQTYSGSEVIQPLVAGSDGGVILGINKTTGELLCTLSATNPGVLLAIAKAVSQPASGMRLYSGADRVQPLFADRSGGVVLGIDTVTGDLAGSAAAKLMGQAAPSSRVALASGERPIRADRNGLLSYGESLSVGVNGLPILSTTQPYSNLTFGAGPKATKAGNSYGGVNTGTGTSKALVEDAVSPAGDGQTNEGETPCSGMANSAVEFASIENGIDPASFVIFASAAGHGGYRISQLKKGAAWYANLLAHVTEAKALATAAGKSYAIQAVAMVLGHNDAGAGTSRATFAAELVQFIADINADFLPLTGQTSPVHLLCYQTASRVTTTAGAIALAYMDAIAASPRIHLATPMYHMRYDGDGTHLTNLGTLTLGRYFGRASKHLIVDGNKPDCVWPLSATARGTELRIKFRVPIKPLILDAVNLALTTDYGFKVLDGSGALTLSNIQVVNGDTVTATLNRALGVNPKARYALDFLGTGLNITSGASGNLRDNSPDTFRSGGVTYPLWNVSPAFELAIINLDPNS